MFKFAIPALASATLLANPSAALAACLTLTPPPASAFEAAAGPAQTPRATKIIHVEGLLPHTGTYDASDAALNDTAIMRNLALAWQFNHNPNDLSRLVGYFNAWSSVYQPNFNPIDETRFDGLIEAYQITQGHLPRGTNDRVKALLVTMADVYLAQMNRHASDMTGIWMGNWNSHRVKIATLAAYATGNPILIAKARQAFVHQVNVNINRNGTTFDFLERNALHYDDYDLQPLVRAALVANANGENWLDLKGTKGQSLRTALNWLVPYAQGEETHEEFVGTKVKFDETRAAAGIPGYSGSWDPKTASDLFWSASLLEPEYGVLARHLNPKPPMWLWVYRSACTPRLTYAPLD